MNYSFQDVIRNRRSFRQFLPTPVEEKVIWEVLSDAHYTPSNCNTQPWDIHIVSGEKKDELSNILLKANAEREPNPDFDFDTSQYFGRYLERQKEQAKVYYDALGIARNDLEARERTIARNFEFFNAPHAAFLFMPSFGDNVRVASDIGMYAQSFLLALTARGIGSIPQTILGFYADTVRDFLGVSKDMNLLFGISFGYPDKDAAANSKRIGRDPMEKSVTFHY